MNIIIAGSRGFNDYALLERIMNRYTIRIDDIKVISGAAKGADKLGEQWALCNMFIVERHHPDWATHGKAAGHIRNKEMAKAAGPKGALVAFHDGISPGTADMIEIAKEMGLKVKVVLYRKTS